jgi:hypothetical protein
MSIEKEFIQPTINVGDKRECSFIIREEELPLYERTARHFQEFGLGEFSLLKTQPQVDDCHQPLTIQGLIRVQERGQGDWVQFWRVVDEVQYHLIQDREEVGRTFGTYETDIDPTIKAVLSKEIYLMQGRQYTIPI